MKGLANGFDLSALGAAPVDASAFGALADVDPRPLIAVRAADGAVKLSFVDGGMSAILMTLAKIAAAEMGKSLAQKLYNFFTGHIATKEDIRRAVEELKRFIVAALRAQDMNEAIYRIHSANLQIKLHGADGSETRLASADEFCAEAEGVLGTFGKEALGPRAFLAATHLSICSLRCAVDAPEPTDINAFGVLLDHYRSELQETIEQSLAYERETLDPITVRKRDYEPRDTRPEPRVNVPAADDEDAKSILVVQYQARVRVHGPLRSGGHDTWESDWLESERDARREAQRKYEELARRIADADERREANVYAPIRTMIAGFEIQLVKLRAALPETS